MSDGWIKLHRSCLDHWLYTEKRPLTKREAWETILLLVNFESSKTLIKGQLYDCKRGQSLFSLKSWADKFNWTIQQVRTFFRLLELDGMITIEGLQYTTRLTVCNWDTYQLKATDQQHTDNTPITDQQHTDNTPITTIKEEEELKNTKEQTRITEVEAATKSICQYFGVDDNPLNHLKVASIHQMTSTLYSAGLIESFNNQFENYRKYKEISKEKEQGLKTFLGTAELKYMDGGWNYETWSKKIADFKAKEKTNTAADNQAANADAMKERIKRLQNQ